MAQTTISSNDFTKLVTQANLILSADEQSKIHPQLDEALDAVKVMDQLDTSAVAQTSSPSGLTNIWRSDIVVPSFTQEEALSNAKVSHQGYFVVPAIFESQDN